MPFGLAIGVLNAEYTLDHRLGGGAPATPSAAQRTACFHFASLVSAHMGRVPEKELEVNWPAFLQRRRVTYQGEAVQHAQRLTL